MPTWLSLVDTVSPGDRYSHFGEKTQREGDTSPGTQLGKAATPFYNVAVLQLPSLVILAGEGHRPRAVSDYLATP